MENQVRNKDRIAHHKKQERLVVKQGSPTVGDIIQGNPQLWFIPDKGLYSVVNYNNKLYYNKYITTTT